MAGTSAHQHTVEVNVPIDVAYHRWTQFETWPEFMEAVDTVDQIAPYQLHWRVTIAGVSREFDTVITEHVPNQRIAWKTNTGPDHAGVVTFHAVDPTTTRIALQMEFEPEGLLEHIGDKLGFVAKRVETDLANFGRLVEDGSALERVPDGPQETVGLTDEPAAPIPPPARGRSTTPPRRRTPGGRRQQPPSHP